jgi:regulator of sirC expression with transglutaminase-like and TPR domain
MMDATARFAQLVASDSGDAVRLDVGALWIAEALRPPVDVDGCLAALDGLAASCAERSFGGIRAAMFGPSRPLQASNGGFAGNTVSYHDPENSLLDAVVRRRLGIPITLAIVMIETGRRIGVDLAPIGMPGHFLVRDEAAGVYCDPFGGGVLLDAEGCRERFGVMFGTQRTFDASFLNRTPSRAVLARVLANLEQTAWAKDFTRLRVMLDLHSAIPGVSPIDRLALAARYEGIGCFSEAAREAELAAEVMSARDAVTARSRATALRARSN